MEDLATSAQSYFKNMFQSTMEAVATVVPAQAAAADRHAFPPPLPLFPPLTQLWEASHQAIRAKSYNSFSLKRGVSPFDFGQKIGFQVEKVTSNK